MQDLFQKINLSFSVYEKNKVLFREAFTHRSVVNEKTKHKKHNERLEFLGDAVLELCMTEFLYETLPQSPEGELTSFRSALVKKETLAQVARELDLGRCLIMSAGEEKSGGKEKNYLLANTVEAFIGAIYLAEGMTPAKKFIRKFIASKLKKVMADGLHIDAKSAFQEYTQGELGITPVYKMLDSSGKDHEKTFVLGVYLQDQKVAEGTGGSKKEAQISAAEAALRDKERWVDLFPHKKMSD